MKCASVLGSWTFDELREFAIIRLKENALYGVLQVNVTPQYTYANHRAISVVLEGESVWRNNSPGSRRLVERFRKIVPATYLVPVNSATAGLHCAFSYYRNRRAGSSYISGYNWYAAGAMPLQAGCVPCFVDITSFRLTPDLNEVPATAQSVLISHLFGSPSITETQLIDLRNKKIPIIEDCAQCISGKVGGERVGLLGEVSIFSFNGSKQIPAGEGGLLATNNADLAQYCENFILTVNPPVVPEIKRFNSASAGFNYRIPAISASLAASLVEEIDWRLQAEMETAGKIASVLQKFQWLTLPTWPRMNSSSPLGLPIILTEQKSAMSLAQSRGLLFYLMQYAGVPASVWVDHVLPDTDLYRSFVDSHGLTPPGSFHLPNARRFAESHLVFPTRATMARQEVLETIQRVLLLYEGL